MKFANFVHLHTHSQYSLLDGACRLDKVIDLAKEYKMPALAITDHGNLFGAIEFYQESDQGGDQSRLSGARRMSPAVVGSTRNHRRHIPTAVFIWSFWPRIRPAIRI